MSWPVAGQAAPIAYSEPPDLGNAVATPTDLGTFDVGTNTVSGSVVLEDSTGDVDAFEITLPAGLRIDAFSIDLLDPIGVTTALRINGSFIDSRVFAAIEVGTFALYTAHTPSLTPGTYLSSINSQALGEARYRFIFEVSRTVPEPVPHSLFAFGLAALGVMARRRRKRDTAA
jgi:hypothetical protein